MDENIVVLRLLGLADIDARCLLERAALSWAAVPKGEGCSSIVVHSVLGRGSICNGALKAHATIARGNKSYAITNVYPQGTLGYKAGTPNLTAIVLMQP